MTDYLGFVIRRNGYNGATIALYLVEDVGGEVLAVWPHGWFEYGTDRADALGRSDIIEFVEA